MSQSAWGAEAFCWYMLVDVFVWLSGGGGVAGMGWLLAWIGKLRFGLGVWVECYVLCVLRRVDTC